MQLLAMACRFVQMLCELHAYETRMRSMIRLAVVCAVCTGVYSAAAAG